MAGPVSTLHNNKRDPTQPARAAYKIKWMNDKYYVLEELCLFIVCFGLNGVRLNPKQDKMPGWLLCPQIHITSRLILWTMCGTLENTNKVNTWNGLATDVPEHQWANKKKNLSLQ